MNLSASCPQIRSATAIRSSRKKEFIDSSIAVAALSLTKIGISCFDTADELKFELAELIIDILFLDIRLKDKNGIALAKMIRKRDKRVQIVFTTNHRQYSLKGYDVGALHYLIKPVSQEKLNIVLDQACLILGSHDKDIVILSKSNELVRVNTNKINYIKMDSHTALLITEANIFNIRKTISDLMKMLPNHFISSHRSYLINLQKIECIYEKEILLLTGERIPVSRSNIKKVREAFLNFHKI